MLLRLCLLLSLTAACGRVGFEGPGGMDGGSDALVPDAVVADGGFDGNTSDSARDAPVSDGSFDGPPGDASSPDAILADGGMPLGSVYLEYRSVQFGTEAPLLASDGDLVGDVRLIATDVNAWTIVIRYARLSSGIPISRPVVIVADLTREADGRFLMEPTSGDPAVVLLLEIAGDRWTFTVDVTDPRSPPADTYAAVSVLQAVAEPPSATNGSWLLESFGLAGASLPARTCSAFMGNYVFFDATFTIDALGSATAEQTYRVYSDSSCTMLVTDDSATPEGFAIERAGRLVDGYLFDRMSDTGLTARYNYDLPTADSLRMRLLSCLPGGCGLPDELLFNRTSMP